MVIVLPVVFLSIAVVINLRNWIYYLIKIGEMAYLKDEKLQKFKNSHWNINALNIVTHAVITINLLFLVCLTTITIVGDKK